MPAPGNQGPPPLKRMILPGLFVLALFLALALRDPGPRHPHLLQGQALGTSWSVKLANQQLSFALSGTVHAVLERALKSIDASMSTYRPDSELMRLNGAPANQQILLSEGLRTVLREALRIGSLSDGAFDVTVGPVVKAWGFGPGGKPGDADPSALALLKDYVGLDKLALSDNGHLEKTHAEVFCDLSAIAKGYAVDRMVNDLEILGFQNFMVELGGEIATRGYNQRGDAWRIGIEAPRPDRREAFRAVALRDRALATSGDYRKFFLDKQQKMRAHLIDPRTQAPIDHGLASVSVMHASCMSADAWATALNVLGPEAGYALAERLELSALFIMRSDDGTLTTRATSTFELLGAKSP